MRLLVPLWIISVILFTTVNCDTDVSTSSTLASTDSTQAFVISTTVTSVTTEPTSSNSPDVPASSQPEVESPTSEPGKPGITLKPEIYSFHIDSDIRYRYSRTYITSRVVNRDPSKSQEITFRVVLPETAFISKFIMEIDGKAYEAYVKEKEEAKKVYNQAQSQGQSAGLVELNTRNSNVFDVSVNIKAQSKVNFNLTYEELLSRRLGRYEQSISISPDQITNVKDFKVQVNIEESQNITLLKVPNLRNDIDAQEDAEGNNKDAIIERPAGNKAVIKWSPTEKDQNQLAKQGITGKFVVQYDILRELDSGEVLVMNGYFVHFFAPENLPALRKHVVFVLDTSGSMWGRKLTQMKEAMLKILADLNVDDYFNILTFAGDVNFWSPEDKTPVAANSNWAPPPFHGEPVQTAVVADPRKRQPFPATPQNIEKAQQFIQSLVASGGTNIQDSVVQALNLTAAIKLARDGEATNETVTTTTTEAPVTVAGNSSTEATNATEAVVPLNILPPNVESLIMFLTDGEPTVGITDSTQIQSAVLAANKNVSVPVFSLGFGEGADFPFLRKMSIQNNGFARRIYEAADAAIQLKGFYNEIASPLLSNVTFNYTSPEYSIQNLTLTKFATVFGGTEIAVAGIIVPKDPAVSDPDAEATTQASPASREILEEVKIEGNQVTPTEKRYFEVNVGGFGRNGHVHFNNPEIFSSPIPWGVPVNQPFPPRPTPVPTQEDLFLERLWAYLTIQQLIEKDLAKQTEENEIERDVNPTPASTTTVPPATTTVVSTITVGNKTVTLNATVVPETPKQKALRLALKYGFVTSLTSLVVVKPNSSDVTDAVLANPSQDTADSLAAPQSFSQLQAIKPLHKLHLAAGRPSFTANRISVGLPLAFPARPFITGGGSTGFHALAPTYSHFAPPAVQALPEAEEEITPGVFTTTRTPVYPSTTFRVPSTTIQTLPTLVPSTEGTDTDKSSGTSSFSSTEPTTHGIVDAQPTIVQTVNGSDLATNFSTEINPTESGSSTQSPTPSLPVTSTQEPEVSPSVPSVSLTLDDLTWYAESILVKVNGSEIVHRIALNATSDDTEGSECGVSGHKGHCAHIKDCLIPAILDDYKLYIDSYFCSIQNRSTGVLYAGTCCATQQKKSS